MAHETHKAEGFVVGGVNTGEAHRYLSLFTRELGLVRGVAKSVREERSKLRYSLQDYSYGTFHLVRGRDVWRVTGAEMQWNAYQDCADDREKAVILSNAFGLMRRLVVGEGENEKLFDALLNGVLFLKNNTPDTAALQNFEHLFVLQILHALGYIRESARFEELLSVPTVTTDYLETLTPLRRSLASHINRALRESHL